MRLSEAGVGGARVSWLADCLAGADEANGWLRGVGIVAARSDAGMTSLLGSMVLVEGGAAGDAGCCINGVENANGPAGGLCAV